MPQPPRQEQQPISAMDFLRGTPGQFRAHKQLPVEPEPVRKGRIRKFVWAIFGFWTLTVVGAVAYLQLTVYAGQIRRAANSAQLTPAASSGAGDAMQPAQEPPAATATELSVAPSPQVLSAATAPVAPPPLVSAVSVDGATLHAPIPPKPPPSAAPVASAPQLDLGFLPLLLSRGNAMLALGDISAARLLYERATALGSAGAATRLGNTYDAAFLASIQARGIVADQAAAIAWYRKAAALGDTEAVHQLKRFAPAQ